jgi:hypothetical protein
VNSFINILTLVLTFPLLALAIYSGFDIPIDSLGMTGSEIPYQQEIFLALGIGILLIQIRRSSRRWMALNLVNKIDRFQWNQPVSQSRKWRVLTYNLIECLVMTSLGIGLLLINAKTFVPAGVFFLFSLDSIVFSLYGTKKYRVGLSSKAILIADREIILIYFTGLRKITLHQQTIYFDYIENLQLTFPTNCIEDKNLAQFFEKLEEVIDKDRVFMNNIHKKK